MKTLLFPVTNRVHKARQQLLIKQLLDDGFDLVVVEAPKQNEDSMAFLAAPYHIWFLEQIEKYDPDRVIIRGDRFEMLPLATSSVYSGVKVAHLEGGDVSGVIDNKVRHAITQLSDIHFATNKYSYRRLINMGTDPDTTFNFGSLHGS